MVSSFFPIFIDMIKLKSILLEAYGDDPELDPDIEGKPYEDDDIWAGSDIAGIKAGGTGVPHGQAYPNSPFRGRKRGKALGRMTREDLDKIVYIRSIADIPEDEEKKRSIIDRKAVTYFLKKHAPWFFNVNWKRDSGGNEYRYGRPVYNKHRGKHYPFAALFDPKYKHTDWRAAFQQTVNDKLEFIEYWLKFPREQLKNQARGNRHWIESYRWAHDVVKQYPLLVDTLRKLSTLASHLYNYAPHNPLNERNYPAYVTLYDVERRLGGHEEGGWWYDAENVVDSVKVNNYQEARKATVRFLKMLHQADLNGKPMISLEKVQGARGNKPPPSYA